MDKLEKMMDRSTFPVTRRFKNKYYEKTTILQTSAIKDKQECWS